MTLAYKHQFTGIDARVARLNAFNLATALASVVVAVVMVSALLPPCGRRAGLVSSLRMRGVVAAVADYGCDVV